MLSVYTGHWFCRHTPKHIRRYTCICLAHINCTWESGLFLLYNLFPGIFHRVLYTHEKIEPRVRVYCAPDVMHSFQGTKGLLVEDRYLWDSTAHLNKSRSIHTMYTRWDRRAMDFNMLLVTPQHVYVDDATH